MELIEARSEEESKEMMEEEQKESIDSETAAEAILGKIKNIEKEEKKEPIRAVVIIPKETWTNCLRDLSKQPRFQEDHNIYLNFGDLNTDSYLSFSQSLAKLLLTVYENEFPEEFKKYNVFYGRVVKELKEFIEKPKECTVLLKYALKQFIGYLNNLKNIEGVYLDGQELYKQDYPNEYTLIQEKERLELKENMAFLAPLDYPRTHCILYYKNKTYFVELTPFSWKKEVEKSELSGTAEETGYRIQRIVFSVNLAYKYSYWDGIKNLYKPNYDYSPDLYNELIPLSRLNKKLKSFKKTIPRPQRVNIFFENLDTFFFSQMDLPEKKDCQTLISQMLGFLFKHLHEEDYLTSIYISKKKKDLKNIDFRGQVPDFIQNTTLTLMCVFSASGIPNDAELAAMKRAMDKKNSSNSTTQEEKNLQVSFELLLKKINDSVSIPFALEGDDKNCFPTPDFLVIEKYTDELNIARRQLNSMAPNGVYYYQKITQKEMEGVVTQANHKKDKFQKKLKENKQAEGGSEVADLFFSALLLGYFQTIFSWKEGKYKFFNNYLPLKETDNFFVKTIKNALNKKRSYLIICQLAPSDFSLLIITTLYVNKNWQPAFFYFVRNSKSPYPVGMLAAISHYLECYYDEKYGDHIESSDTLYWVNWLSWICMQLINLYDLKTFLSYAGYALEFCSGTNVKKLKELLVNEEPSIANIDTSKDAYRFLEFTNQAAIEMKNKVQKCYEKSNKKDEAINNLLKNNAIRTFENLAFNAPKQKENQKKLVESFLFFSEKESKSMPISLSVENKKAMFD